MSSLNPTDSIRLDYEAFVDSREMKTSEHLVDGIPDYSFSLDHTIRKKLNRIPFLVKATEGLMSLRVPLFKIQYEEQGIVVGPNQFPKIYDMAVDCARILGIPIPTIYISYDIHPNAFTLATGHSDQMIVITTGLLEALNDAELKFVIGHECGHIHNRHVVYNTLWEIVTNQMARSLFYRWMASVRGATIILPLLSTAFEMGTGYLFGRWHRCAEITCDRAGLICSGDLDAAMNTPGRIRLGGAGGLEGFNKDAYKNQMRNWNRSLFRVQELLMTHPPGPQRSFAVELFAHTNLYRKWRPDVEVTAETRTLDDVDQEISNFFT